MRFGRIGTIVRNLALCGVMVFAVACSSAAPEVKYEERPVEKLYNQAMEYLLEENYRFSAAYFAEVERQHPYSIWARRSMLMAAYSYYMLNDYQDAVLAAERFIGLHPGNRDVPYAYYLIAISYYEQISDVGRDQRATEDALAALREVSRRFPGTEYARDASLKIDLTHDHLAGKEMDVGRWYLRRGIYIGGINRFRNVIEKYQTTTHVPEALHRLCEAYLSLGLEHEARMAAAVLGHNYPGSRWYEDSYALLEERDLQVLEYDSSWLGRVWGSIF